jgi:hypothetical protein
VRTARSASALISGTGASGEASRGRTMNRASVIARVAERPFYGWFRDDHLESADGEEAPSVLERRNGGRGDRVWAPRRRHLRLDHCRSLSARANALGRT